MAVTTLPDLKALSPEAMRVLILAQHQELITKDEQLLSRENEIAHLKLLLAKLQRLQFGRKSERIQRQIEQLELRLEELESNPSEKESLAPGAMPVAAASPVAPTKPARRALPDHLPRQTRTHRPKQTVCPQCRPDGDRRDVHHC